MHNNLTTCLWFATEAAEAAAYYCSIFPDGRILSQNPVVTEFQVRGSRFMALNGGKPGSFNDSVSFVIACETQQEIDYFWEKLTANGGQESMCGWLKDRYGVSWQVIPSELPELMNNPETARKVMEAFLPMRKLDIETLKKAVGK
jgi:predicted 3-demethylubiquinone-9 3-methyltransferase (glyoxalase superfamily)